MTPATTATTFSDAQLADELAFARMERAAGGTLGQRTRVAERIRQLETEQLRRLWDAS